LKNEMLKKIAFFSIMVEKTCISAYFCSMTYKKTNRRDDDKRRGAEGGRDNRGAEGGRDSAKGKSYRGAESGERGAKSREFGAGSRDRKPYSSDRPERKNYSSDRPARSDERGAGSRDRKPYGSDRPERKNYSSDRPERKSYNSDRPARSDERGAGSRDRKPYSSDRPERKSNNSDRPARSDERGAGSRDRKPYSSDRPERKNYSSDRPERKSYSSDRPERKSYSSDRPARNDERGAGSRDRKPFSSDRPERKSYTSDKPKRKSSTSRTPAPKPGPFDKFNIDKMREAKAESMEKKERKRPNSRRDAERGRESANSRDFRGAERAERGRDSANSRGDRDAERAESRERGEERPARTERIERTERTERPERRSDSASENTRGKGVERRKTDPDEEIRLNRYIANSGVCSRRKADELIEKGEVTVNDEVIRELGYKVKYTDKIKFQGKLLKPGNLVYILLNKPKDYITTTDDPMERRTVLDLTAKITNERIFPVGRLDRNTTGLLLLTNDGDLADKLSHPRNQVRKVYEVELDKSLIAKDFEQVRDGVELEDGFAKVDQISYLDGKSKKFVGVEIHIGRNRIVRRIFESLGYEVVRLDRVIYAGLTKKDLSRGRCRMLSKEELIYLKHLNKY
jgi:23S rRNA pseudouridine2605 synthase